jgi:hypothetical protein
MKTRGMKCEVKRELNSVIVREERNDTTKPSGIESEENRNVKMKCEVKQGLNSVIVREEMNDTTKPVMLGVKAQLTELPMA